MNDYLVFYYIKENTGNLSYGFSEYLFYSLRILYNVLMLSPQVINNLQKEYLKLVVKYLKDGTLDLTAAKNRTKEFIAIFPLITFEDAKSKLSKFTHLYQEFGSLTIFLLKTEEEITQQLLKKMQVYIRQDKISQALNLMK